MKIMILAINHNRLVVNFFLPFFFSNVGFPKGGLRHCGRWEEDTVYD